MPVLNDTQVVKYVRSKTTDNEAELSNDQILYFAGRGADTSYAENVDGDGNLDLAGVIADSWEYIARDIRYMSETHGPVSGSQPTPLRMAALWRSRSWKGGNTVEVAVLRRTDTPQWPRTTTNEFGV